jgi:hypothetical protein
MLHQQTGQSHDWGNLSFSADAGGSFGSSSESGAETTREVTIGNFCELPADVGESDLLQLKKIEPTKFRAITEAEEAAGGYTDKYGKLGHRDTHLVSQRPVRGDVGEIVGWEDRSPILIDEKEGKYEPHPTEEGCFIPQGGKFTTVLVPRKGETIHFNNANEEYAGSVTHGDGNSLAFDSKGVPYSFPMTKNIDQNRAFEIAGSISRAEFAVELGD